MKNHTEMKRNEKQRRSKNIEMKRKPLTRCTNEKQNSLETCKHCSQSLVLCKLALRTAKAKSLIRFWDEISSEQSMVAKYRNAELKQRLWVRIVPSEFGDGLRLGFLRVRVSENEESRSIGSLWLQRERESETMERRSERMRESQWGGVRNFGGGSIYNFKTVGKFFSTGTNILLLFGRSKGIISPKIVIWLPISHHDRTSHW